MEEIGRGMVCRCPIGKLTLSLTYPFLQMSAGLSG